MMPEQAAQSLLSCTLSTGPLPSPTRTSHSRVYPSLRANIKKLILFEIQDQSTLGPLSYSGERRKVRV